MKIADIILIKRSRAISCNVSDADWGGVEHSGLQYHSPHRHVSGRRERDLPGRHDRGVLVWYIVEGGV